MSKYLLNFQTLLGYNWHEDKTILKLIGVDFEKLDGKWSNRGINRAIGEDLQVSGAKSNIRKSKDLIANFQNLNRINYGIFCNDEDQSIKI